MKKFNVSITCMACYNATIDVPDDATYEDALEIAKAKLDDIPLGELEYIPYSDEIDEENCEFLDDDECCFEEGGAVEENENQYDVEEDEDEEGDCPCENKGDYSAEQCRMLKLWQLFDNIMTENGYDLCITDSETLAEEIAQFGKASSCMGTVATKTDRFTPFFRLYIHSDYMSYVIRVYDRRGDAILSGRELAFINVTPDMSESETRAKIRSLVKEFSKYGKDNPVPIK